MTAATKRGRATTQQRSMFEKSTVGEQRESLAPQVTAAPSNDHAPAVGGEPELTPPSVAAVYETTGPFTTWRWLCAKCVKIRQIAGWTCKLVAGQNVLVPPYCDDCEARKKAIGDRSGA